MRERESSPYLVFVQELFIINQDGFSHKYHKSGVYIKRFNVVIVIILDSPGRQEEEAMLS